MEFQFTIYVFLLIVTIFLFIRSRKSLDTKKNLPPHPWKLPLIGHLHQLIGGGESHHALANLATKLGPIVHLQLGELSTILISSPSLAKEIMKTNDLSFASRPKFLGAEIMLHNCQDIAFSPYGDYWRQMRKICVLELLSVKKVKSFQSIREEETWKLVEFMGNQRLKTTNFSDKIVTMMNTIACRVVVGSKLKDQASLVALMKEMVSFSIGFDVTDLFPSIKVLHVITTSTRNKMMKIRKKTDELLDNIISDHQECRAAEEHKEDILDVLLRLQEDGGLQFPLTSDSIKAVILDMFLGGTDTSATIIEWAMSELMKNPMAMKKAQAELRQAFKGKKMIHESDIQELDYLKLVIKETLRLHPPLPLLLPRECRDKCEIGGYDIDVNTKVIINMWKIGRDSNYWIDPNDFIPERFSETTLIDKMGNAFEYLPFGDGRRMCPGSTLGLANVEFPLAMILYHFNWDLPNGGTYEDLDMTESFGATLGRKHNLLLIPSPYHTNQ